MSNSARRKIVEMYGRIAELERQNAKLVKALEKANSQTEEYERFYYLENHKVDALVKALRESRHALQVANDKPNGPICDTIWMPEGPETLFDYMDAAIESAQPEQGDKNAN